MADTPVRPINEVDLRDPAVRKLLRRGGVLNAHRDVQRQYLSTADLRAAYRPRTPLNRTGAGKAPRRARVVKSERQEDGSFTLVTPDGQTFEWPEKYMPEEPLKGWNRRVHVCFRWQVEDLLRDLGWLTWHCEYESRSEPDIWDLVCLREREMWLELKVRDEKGQANGLTPGQYAFGYRLTVAGSEHHVITWPDDWLKLKELAA